MVINEINTIDELLLACSKYITDKEECSICSNEDRRKDIVFSLKLW